MRISDWSSDVCSSDLPLSIFYKAGASFDSQSPLLRLIMENADHALDPVRFDLCHYRRLQYLPAKPGWIGDTALVYMIPADRALKADRKSVVSGQSVSVLVDLVGRRTMNNKKKT